MKLWGGNLGCKNRCTQYRAGFGHFKFEQRVYQRDLQPPEAPFPPQSPIWHPRNIHSPDSLTGTLHKLRLSAFQQCPSFCQCKCGINCDNASISRIVFEQAYEDATNNFKSRFCYARFRNSYFLFSRTTAILTSLCKLTIITKFRLLSQSKFSLVKQL